VTVVGADEDLAACIRERSFDGAVGAEDPARPAARGVQRVDAAVPVADVDEAADDER
jgi:hypothetical protein